MVKIPDLFHCAPRYAAHSKVIPKAE